MYEAGGTETGFVGLAIAISTLETLVEKGILNSGEARDVVAIAHDELVSAGKTVNLSTAIQTMEEYVLPRFTPKPKG